MKQLEYGKWYSVDEAMPEDFEELKEENSDFTEDVLAVVYYGDCYDMSVHCRRFIKSTNDWEWCTLFDTAIITHWLAIPPLNKESNRETKTNNRSNNR